MQVWQNQAEGTVVYGSIFCRVHSGVASVVTVPPKALCDPLGFRCLVSPGNRGVTIPI